MRHFCSPSGRGGPPSPVVHPLGCPAVGSAVLLTGTGKRYDIVASFAQHATVVACDPNPISPAQYAATVRTSVPLISDPEYVPALQRLCAEHDVGAIVPLTDLDIEALAQARAD